MDMKKTILFCLPPTCGGAERVTITIAKTLDSNLFDIKFVIIGNTKGEIIEFIPNSFEVYHIRIKNIWDFTTFKLIKLFNKLNPHIVFCSLMYLNIRVILAAKLQKATKIIVRNNNSVQVLRFDQRFLLKWTYRLADSIILQTEEMKIELQEIMHLKPNKLHVIFNPIDKNLIDEKVKSISPSLLNQEYINYVYVGRINHSKGLDVLIPAFYHLVKEKKIKCRLYIIGKIDSNNNYYLKLKEMIKNYQITDKIFWIGFTNNPYQYIKSANCFVLPSRIEGLPNVVLEAMYLKTPVVVTRSVPVIDRLVPNSRGIIINPNDIQALTEALTQAINIKITQDYTQSSITELKLMFNQL